MCGLCVKFVPVVHTHITKESSNSDSILDDMYVEFYDAHILKNDFGAAKA